jgi:hypothetical protein
MQKNAKKRQKFYEKLHGQTARIVMAAHPAENTGICLKTARVRPAAASRPARGRDFKRRALLDAERGGDGK